jgi:hypothetical protein
VVVSRPDPRERASYVVDDGSAPPAGALSKTVLGGGVLALYRLPP